METIYTVVGFYHGVSKNTGKPFTKLALEFEVDYQGYVGKDVKSEFVNHYVEVQVGDQIDLVYGCRNDGKAFVRDIQKI